MEAKGGLLDDSAEKGHAVGEDEADEGSALPPGKQSKCAVFSKDDSFYSGPLTCQSSLVVAGISFVRLKKQL